MLSRCLAPVLILLAAGAHALTPPPFQRVLVPISVADVPGAKDSLWTAELWAVNGNTEKAEIGALPCIVSPLSGCAPAFELPPGQSTRVPALGSSQNPGVLLMVPAHLANQVAFNLHVRDLNRQSESWGAEVPVVRERDFFTGPSHMTNVPFGGDYRQTLRIYALLNTETARFRVRMYEVTGTREDRLLRDDVVTLVLPPSPPPNMIGTPLAQIAVTDMFLIEIGGVNRVRVSIEPMTEPTALLPPIPYWAFVSITNNNTQQVTTVTPR